MNMRKYKTSRFDRWLQDFDSGSVSSYVRLAVMSPFLIVKLVIYGMLALVILIVLAVFPSAWSLVERAFREAEAHGQSDRNSTRLKGGEARQKGTEWKGSLVRSGGPLSSDDLRRRLYELREAKPERKVSLTRNVGGQNGE
ncbi:MAG: hypothetical protein KDA89_03105 [Planctomycetaceae bacterium]|nr:hypothetical protein [Planctomycetaceae bacterium]